MRGPIRPALRYLGGKWRLAPWIVSHFPAHHTYIEPFGGAASVLLRKARVSTEVYNDLDDDVVSFFRVLRDPCKAQALTTLLRLTPYARAEFLAAYEPCVEPVERARRLVVRSFMGFGSCASRIDRNTGFRTGHRLGESPSSREWSTYADGLELIIARLAGVAIEKLPAETLMARRDAPGVLWYVDPPYVHATRSPRRTRTAPSSGYGTPLYDRALKGWRRVERATTADGGRPRTEVLWINPAAQAAALMDASAARTGGAPDA